MYLQCAPYIHYDIATGCHARAVHGFGTQTLHELLVLEMSSYASMRIESILAAGCQVSTVARVRLRQSLLVVYYLSLAFLSFLYTMPFSACKHLYCTPIVSRTIGER